MADLLTDYSRDRFEHVSGRRLLIPIWQRVRRAFSISDDAVIEGVWSFSVGLAIERIGFTNGVQIRITWGWSVVSGKIVGAHA